MIVNLKELKKQARVNFKNPYKVGDILHHSWDTTKQTVTFTR